MDTRSDFNTYRLIIRGNNMSIHVNGKMVIRGKDAFWKHDELPGAFIQFGSNSEKLMGESYWEYVRLEVHKVTGKPAPPKLRITLSEPWDIPSLPPGNPHIRPYDMIHRNTRPYLYDVGQGILLMSVAQGPDAILEPYGVLKSTNAGQTWQPVNDLQYKSFAPLPMIRLPDNSILDVSRWAVKYEREEGVFIEMRYIFDPEANSFTMHESLIRGLQLHDHSLSESCKVTIRPRYTTHAGTLRECGTAAIIFFIR